MLPLISRPGEREKLLSRRIVVSDLHIDTWVDCEMGPEHKPRKDYFFAFLDWCLRSGVRELVMNGDLMDLPPYLGQEGSTADPEVVREVLERLLQFACQVPVSTIFGNHDIGVSGMRNFGLTGVPALDKATFHYPNYVIDDYPDSTIIIEHGHRYDPVLFLYVQDLARVAFRKDDFQLFQLGMQRRGHKDATRVEPPGVLEPLAVEDNVSAFEAAKSGPLAREASVWSKVWRITHKFRRVAITKLKREWWAEMAVDQMRKYVKTTLFEGGAVKPNLYLIFGHTHRADYRDSIDLKRARGIYINSGTWTRASERGWYLDIDESGKVWVRDWINEPPPSANARGLAS